ncbi:MAG: quinolinate synthase [archaeon GW2011_AR21]|nr:MAG: quinolinate synthase [archaeon GW2011_AR21]
MGACLEEKKIIREILRLKKEKNAVILVHNYQNQKIYQVADVIGDSFELSKAAAKTDAEIIVFCGVDFMAETAKLLNPEKKVLLPEQSASCPMAKMVCGDEIRELRKKHPKAAVVSYVNTRAETKAESDACCTSANAAKVVNSLENEEIIFTPDKNLADFVRSKTSKKIISWPGYCCVHENISPEAIKRMKSKRKKALVLAHPECKKEVLGLADFVCSTSQMISKAKESKAKEFIIVTEKNMVARLRKEVPGKKFYSVQAVCRQMKKTTLTSVLDSLKFERNEITIPKEFFAKARSSLEKMLEIGA